MGRQAARGKYGFVLYNRIRLEDVGRWSGTYRVSISGDQLRLQSNGGVWELQRVRAEIKEEEK